MPTEAPPPPPARSDDSAGQELPWWRTTTIYQVYPRSFQDSNGDGIGDLRGVIDRLDYLVDLGVGAVWLSPFFASPQKDFGYDVADYLGIAPEYGDEATVLELIEAAHSRGLKVIFDMVLNHTSDEHPWFVESRSSRENQRADWYIWHEGRRGPLTWLTGKRRPPNNWKATLDLTTAWQWSPERKQFFLASFLPFQPDLNWHNPQVKQAMFAAARHWLEAGVDGFRLDVFGWIVKDESFRSNPWRPEFGGGDIVRLWRRDFTENTEGNIALAKELRAVATEVQASKGGPERMLVGEVFGEPDVIHRYLGGHDAANPPGLSLAFAFDFLAYRYSASYFRELIASYESHFAAPMLPAYVLENHDRSRTLNRVGGDERKARLLAVLLLTLRAVPTVYQGQEIGSTNTYLPLNGALDPLARTFFPWLPEWVSRRMPERINRDEVRTPMQWDSSPHAGFTREDARPWLPLNPEWTSRNVHGQAGDPDSIWSLYRSLLHVRKALPELNSGSLTLLPAAADVIAFERVARDEAAGDKAAGEGTAGDRVVAVALNFSDAQRIVSLPSAASELLVASGQGVAIEGSAVTLPPHTAAVVRIGRA